MNPRIRPSAWAIPAALSAAAALSGCGKMGELDRPGPLFGKAAPASAEGAQQQQQQPAEQRTVGQHAHKGVQTVDPRDITMDPTVPPRANPLPGQGSDPFRQPPPTALPDPYANPQ